MKRHRGVESELKYRLDRKEYERLIKAHRKWILRTERHANYYFDDVHLNLRKRRIGLRIRIAGRLATLTLKYPKQGRTELRALKVRREFEAKLPYPVAARIIRGDKDILSLRVYPITKLRRIFPVQALCPVQSLGRVQTQRTVVPLNHKFQMEIDRSEIFGKNFYELEVETHRPAKADRLVHNLFWKYGIAYQPIRRSKLARFLSAWSERR